MIAGVCSGIAEYLDIDPTVVRLLFVLFTFMGGGGVIVYLVLWIIMPERPESKDVVVEVKEKPATPKKVAETATKKTPAKKATTAKKPAAPKKATTSKPAAGKTTTKTTTKKPAAKPTAPKEDNQEPKGS